jgi:integrase
MAQSKLFTEKYLRSLGPGEKVRLVNDGMNDSGLTGFGIMVYPSGLKSFVLRYQSPETGKRVKAILGGFPNELGLAAARQKSREWRHEIRRGIDPKQAQKRQTAAVVKAVKAEREEKEREARLGTVDDLFRLYLADMEEDGKRSLRTTKNIYNADIKPMIGNKRPGDVVSDDIADIVGAIVERGAPSQASRARTVLRAAFNFGRTIEKNPRWRRREKPIFKIGDNPVADIKKPEGADRPGNRYLSKTELQEVWLALGQEYEVIGGHGSTRTIKADKFTEIALKLLLLTGQRVEEVLEARWDEFDLAEKLWSIPAERRKNADKNTSMEPHLVPLTDLHICLLKELEPYSEGSAYLFHKMGNLNEPRPNKSLSQFLRRFCNRAEIKPFVPKDCRRTVKTLMGSIGIDLEIRNRIQGHAFSDVGSKNYDRWDYISEKRLAMEKWAEFIGGG